MQKESKEIFTFTFDDAYEAYKRNDVCAIILCLYFVKEDRLNVFEFAIFLKLLSLVHIAINECIISSITKANMMLKIRHHYGINDQ